MAGWPVRTPKQRLTAPLSGYKLARPMLSADGTRAGFAGVILGRSTIYGVVAEATCAQGSRHKSPSRWCDCGFYCLHTLADARALACDPDYRDAVLVDVAASGRFLRYERGLRYARQRVSRVRVGRCGCGQPATVFSDSGTGSVGWRRLVAVCPACAGPRLRMPLATFSRLLGGVPVVADQSDSSPAHVADRELVPVLAAEIALLQARLDEVQRQLDGLANRD
jgi:hypothetical protein